MKPLTPIQKRAERRSRNQSMVDMNLVSLIDVFTILIFFLMSNVGVETLASTRAVTLPESMSQKAPKETVLVTVTASEILVGDMVVAAVRDAIAVDGDLIQPLKLEVIVRANRIEVNDKHGGALPGSPFPNLATGPDIQSVSALLLALKLKYPQHDDASVLVENEIPYDRVVQVMDAVREVPAAHGDRAAPVPLFPDISIGDAPIAAAAGE